VCEAASQQTNDTNGNHQVRSTPDVRRFLALIAASSLGLAGSAANASASNSIAGRAYQQTNLVPDILRTSRGERQ
jgi:predicted Zn-dependent protease